MYYIGPHCRNGVQICLIIWNWYYPGEYVLWCGAIGAFRVTTRQGMYIILSTSLGYGYRSRQLHTDFNTGSVGKGVAIHTEYSDPQGQTDIAW